MGLGFVNILRMPHIRLRFAGIYVHNIFLGLSVEGICWVNKRIYRVKMRNPNIFEEELSKQSYLIVTIYNFKSHTKKSYS